MALPATRSAAARPESESRAEEGIAEQIEARRGFAVAAEVMMKGAQEPPATREIS